MFFFVLFLLIVLNSYWYLVLRGYRKSFNNRLTESSKENQSLKRELHLMENKNAQTKQAAVSILSLYGVDAVDKFQERLKDERNNAA